MMALSRMKQIAKKIITMLPGEGWFLISLYRKLGLIKRIIIVKYHNITRESILPESEKVFWIDPSRIKMHTNYQQSGINTPNEDRVFDPINDKSKIYSGDWDIAEYKFSDLDVYKAFEARINKGEEWVATAYYINMLKQIEAGNGRWGCKNKEDLVKRCSYLDSLIESIKKDGYKLNHEIKLDFEDTNFSKDENLSEEVSVNISRKGEYLFQDGRHRLAIAQILKINKIPVKVLVRHKQWVEFRQFIYSMTEGVGGASKHGALYQIPIHPDLMDIPASHGCEDRMNAIEENLTKRSGTLLDVGTNLGFFCHKFEDIGYDCYAIEHTPDIAVVTDKLRESEGKKFKVIAGDLYDVAYKPPLKNMKFDVVLLLSVVHHSLKKKEGYTRLKDWLNTLDVEEIFFEPHNPSEVQMQTAYKNYQEDEFVQFILDNTKLCNSEVIHKCDDGRRIYRLFK